MNSRKYKSSTAATETKKKAHRISKISTGKYLLNINKDKIKVITTSILSIPYQDPSKIASIWQFNHQLSTNPCLTKSRIWPKLAQYRFLPSRSILPKTAKMTQPPLLSIPISWKTQSSTSKMLLQDLELTIFPPKVLPGTPNLPKLKNLVSQLPGSNPEKIFHPNPTLNPSIQNSRLAPKPSRNK